MSAALAPTSARWRSVAASARPPFLLLTVAVLLPGFALAARVSAPGIDWLWVALAALAAHVAVNALNEWVDFRSGLDARTERTPFSGGSGALPADPGAATAVLLLALGCLALMLLTGVHFLVLRGPLLLLPGGLGLLVVLAYSPWLNRHPLPCLLAPGLGIGIALLLGVEVALTGRISRAALAASLLPFFLANALLLLNQVPDLAADASVGRRHWGIAYGLRSLQRIYRGLLTGAAASLLAGVWLGWLPTLALLALLPSPLGLRALRGLAAHLDQGAALQPALAANVALSLSAPALLGLGLYLAG